MRMGFNQTSPNHYGTAADNQVLALLAQEYAMGKISEEEIWLMNEKGQLDARQVNQVLSKAHQRKELELKYNALDMMSHEFVAGKITTKDLSDMVRQGNVTPDDKKYIIKTAADIQAKLQKQVEMGTKKTFSVADPMEDIVRGKQIQVVAKKPAPRPQIPQRTPKEIQEKMMAELLLEKDDQRIVDKLPDLLGFKFCPMLFVGSGILPPPDPSGLSPEYELAYLENMKTLLKQFKHLAENPPTFSGKAREKHSVLYNKLLASGVHNDLASVMVTYMCLWGGSLADGQGVNPSFPRNLWLNALGMKLDQFVSDEVMMIAFSKEYICSRIVLACNGISSIKRTIAEIAERRVQVAQQIAQEEAVDPTISNEEQQITTAAVTELEQETTQAQQAVVTAEQEAVLAQLEENVASTEEAQSSLPHDSAQSDVQPSGIMDQNGQVVTTDIAATDSGHYDQQQVSQLPTDIFDPNRPSTAPFDFGPSVAPQLPEPIMSDVPGPEDKPFYKKTGNQALIVAGLVGLGLYMSGKKKTKKKSEPIPSSLNPFHS